MLSLQDFCKGKPPGVLPGNSRLVHHTLPPEFTADALLVLAKALPLTVEPPLLLYGRVCHAHRCIGFFSNASVGYKYSGQVMPAQPLPEWLAHLLAAVNAMLSTDYNGVLVNLYRNGTDYIGPHADDETALGSASDSGKHGLSGACVTSISLGATRTFRVRDKATKTLLLDLPLTHGSFITMAGSDFQRLLTHEVPPQKGCNALRVSLTFRKHLA